MERTIALQKLKIPQTVFTLNDLQKLLGAINWVRLVLGLSTEMFSPLFQILKGDSDLTSTRRLTPEAQTALQTVLLQISIHWPKQPMLQFLRELMLYPATHLSYTPIKNALRIFTDGSGKTHKSVIVWKKNDEWHHDVQLVEGSTQIVELAVVVRALYKWKDLSLNLVSDSAYVVNVIQCAEWTML